MSDNKWRDLSARKVDIADIGYSEPSTSSMATSAVIAGGRSRSQDVGWKGPRTEKTFEKPYLVENYITVERGAETSETNSTYKAESQGTIRQCRRHSSNPAGLQRRDSVPKMAAIKLDSGSNDGDITSSYSVGQVCENNPSNASTPDPSPWEALPTKTIHPSSSRLPKDKYLYQVSERPSRINEEPNYHAPSEGSKTAGPEKRTQRLTASRRRSMML
jgi:hypothetical protein